MIIIHVFYWTVALLTLIWVANDHYKRTSSIDITELVADITMIVLFSSFWPLFWTMFAVYKIIKNNKLSGRIEP